MHLLFKYFTCYSIDKIIQGKAWNPLPFCRRQDPYIFQKKNNESYTPFNQVWQKPLCKSCPTFMYRKNSVWIQVDWTLVQQKNLRPKFSRIIIYKDGEKNP